MGTHWRGSSGMLFLVIAKLGLSYVGLSNTHHSIYSLTYSLPALFPNWSFLLVCSRCVSLQSCTSMWCTHGHSLARHAAKDPGRKWPVTETDSVGESRMWKSPSDIVLPSNSGSDTELMWMAARFNPPPSLPRVHAFYSLTRAVFLMKIFNWLQCNNEFEFGLLGNSDS